MRRSTTISSRSSRMRSPRSMQVRIRGGYAQDRASSPTVRERERASRLRDIMVYRAQALIRIFSRWDSTSVTSCFCLPTLRNGKRNATTRSTSIFRLTSSALFSFKTVARREKFLCTVVESTRRQQSPLYDRSSHQGADDRQRICGGRLRTRRDHDVCVYALGPIH